jgi:hypothetical protein
MIKWISIEDELPNSDEPVLIKTSKGCIYSAYLDLEHILDDSVWKRTWLSNLNSAEIENYLDVDEVIVQWSLMPKD